MKKKWHLQTNNAEKSKADFTVTEICFANISKRTAFLLQGVLKLTLWQKTLRFKTLVCDLQGKRCLTKEINNNQLYYQIKVKRNLQHKYINTKRGNTKKKINNFV